MKATANNALEVANSSMLLATDVKTEIATMRTDMSSLKAEVAALRTGLPKQKQNRH